MPNYNCARCGYTCIHLGHFKKHLTKKKGCEPLYSNAERSVLFEALKTAEGKKSANAPTVPLTLEDEDIEDIEDKDAYIRNLHDVVAKLRHANVRLMHAQPPSSEGEAHAHDAPICVEESEESEGQVAITCSKCEATFEDASALETHMRAECPMAVHFDNVYAYNAVTFGRSLYADESRSGDIYIVQTDFCPGETQYYKVGKTTNVPRRMVQYRTGAVREPRLHCYFPFRDMARADADLKVVLERFHVKREIYAGDLAELKAAIRAYQMRTDGCLAEFSPRLA
jgi:hypothetical protein